MTSLKIIFVIIGTLIGAGFASRARSIFVFLFIWEKRNYWNFYCMYNYGNCNLQDIKNNKRK